MERLYIIAYAFCLVTASYRQKARFQWGERRRKGASQKVFGSEKNWELLVYKLSAPFLGPAFKGLCLTCHSRLLLCPYPPIPRASATAPLISPNTLPPMFTIILLPSPCKTLSSSWKTLLKSPLPRKFLSVISVPCLALLYSGLHQTKPQYYLQYCPFSWPPRT